MYLWQIEYNCPPSWICTRHVVNRFKSCIFDRLNTTKKSFNVLNFMLWIALNHVSLTDWIQQSWIKDCPLPVVNRFKSCIFDRLNTTFIVLSIIPGALWIALNHVSLTDWIQQDFVKKYYNSVVNRFKSCIFDRLNTTWWTTRTSLFVVNRFKSCIFDRLNTTTPIITPSTHCCESL